jgi:hypothetical protein
MASPVFCGVLIRYFVTPHPRSEVLASIFVMMLRVIFVPPAAIANYFLNPIMAALDHFFVGITGGCFLRTIALHVCLGKPFCLCVVRHDQEE